MSQQSTEDLGFTIYRREIPEEVIDDKRLGRHVFHDSRSLNCRVAKADTIVSKKWTRQIPILNQLDLGSCTGNAATGALGTGPLFDALADKLKAGLSLDEPEAVKIYSLATTLDPFSGAYPPDDTGSNGLSVAKACQQLGLISGYTHALSLSDLLSGLQTGPMIIGSNWYESMDSPDSSGLVTVSGSVRGGHEYECLGVDVEAKILHFANSWGTGWGQAGYFAYNYDSMTRLLSEDGDATKFVPLSSPAPTPTPGGDAPFLGATVPVATRIRQAAVRRQMNVTDYQNLRWSRYFNLS
jgi:hypothetical protein